ncbi:MAG: antibiotic biosynthesis monooxygenase family protein [Rhodobacterales bacterium]
MHALFFEMRPKPGHLKHYFDHVARLRPSLARNKGLVFLDRYGSLTDPGLLLSHQLWESEDAIVAWRKDAEHRKAQAAGIKAHFVDYRIRVGRRVLHQKAARTETHTLKIPNPEQTCVLAVYGGKPVLNPIFSAFKSFNHNDRFISLASFDSFSENDIRVMSALPDFDEIAAYSIRRDYGQFDRTQAPC